MRKVEEIWSETWFEAIRTHLVRFFLVGKVEKGCGRFLGRPGGRFGWDKDGILGQKTA